MSISAFLARRSSRLILTLGLIALPVGVTLWHAWQEWAYRTALPGLTALTPLEAAPPSKPVVFNPNGIATVLGFAPQGAAVRSAEALTLRASLVSSQGQSRALLAGTSEARFYSVGDRLPGGSVLRRIEVSRVVLWRNGREESLVLESAGQYLLPVTRADAPKAQPASTYLRPVAEQP